MLSLGGEPGADFPGKGKEEGSFRAPRVRLVTSQSWVAAHPSVPRLQAGRFQATDGLQNLHVPGSYPGSLPWDKLFQQQGEIIKDVFLAFSAGDLSLRCLAFSSPSHIHLRVTTSQLSFPFHTHLPTPCCYPRRMAVSHLAVLQGTEKSYKELDPILPPPAEATWMGGRTSRAQRQCSELVPGVSEMLQLLPGGLRCGGKNNSSPARKWPCKRNGGVLLSFHSAFSALPRGGL